ncbi:MAG: ATP-dependent helicase, partial [Myxococcota bacterium]
RGEGPKVRRMETADSATEAKAITLEIRKHLEQGVKAAEIALLYRSAGTSRLLEEELRLAGIPYQLYGGTQFFDRKEVKDALAYLRAAVHPQDELSLRRILNHPPRGIGATTVKRLERYALANEISFANALAAAPSMNDLPEPARRGIMALQETLRETRGRFQRGEDLASAARDLFTRTGLEREVRAQDAEGTPRRWGNIESLLRSLNRYQNTPQATRPTLAQFLIRIGLRFDQEEETRGNRVTLSTLHAAKGLEFDVVFLVGCIEGQLPHNRSLEPKVTEAAPSDVNEERRLFYVGITRAREVLYLTLVKQKMLRGKTGPVTPTRFLDGIPEGLIETISTDVKKELDRQETAAAAQAIVDLLSR